MNYTFFTLQLILAATLGGLVGWQRSHIHKAAGFRTYILVSVGSALFTILSLYAFGDSDPGRVASQILTGIGFIGAGAILHKKDSTEGVTTAAGLWAIAAIGMAVGAGWLVHATIAAFIIFLVLLMNDDEIMKR